MVVGVCRVLLALPFNDSLKGKRSIVKSIVERARGRFHVAAAEVGDLDAHKRATLGFAVVSNDARHAQSVLDKLVSFVAGATEAAIVDKRTTIEHYDLGMAVSPLSEDHWNPPEWDDDGSDEEG